MSSDAKLAQLKKVQNQISGMIESGKSYDALRLIVTISNRYITAKNYDAAVSLTKESAIALLAKGEGNLAAQVGEQLISALEKSNSKLTTDIEQVFATIFRSFVEHKDLIRQKMITATIGSGMNDTTMTETGAVKPKLEDPALRFMKAALAWSAKAPREESTDAMVDDAPTTTPTPKKSSLSNPSMLLSKLLAHYLATQKSFSKSNSNYIKTNAPAAHAALLIQWAHNGDVKYERDLFITRGVLLYLAACNTTMSNSNVISTASELLRIFSLRFKYDATYQSSPLIHFVQFLLQAMEWNKVELFKMLKNKYEFALTSRDEALGSILEKIGQRYFGLSAPKGLLDSLFGGSD